MLAIDPGTSIVNTGDPTLYCVKVGTLPLHSHLLVNDLSTPFRISPFSEIHVPGGISSRRSCCFRCIAGARRRRLLGASNVCASTDALLICGARTSSRSWDRQEIVYINHELNSLSFVGLQGYVLYGYTSARCLYLVDRSWYIVHIVGKFLFSMLRTLQWYQSRIYA